MKSPREYLESALPLKILRFEVNDPIVNLIGETWSLTLMCPWAISRPGTDFDWEAGNLHQRIGELVGRSIVGAEAENEDLVDPIFILDDGTRIQLFADTDVDPWTLGLPEIMIIGESRK